MWIDKQTLHWNPWDTDRRQKKRWCHIRGMQKMNEYYILKQKNESDKIDYENKRGGSKGLSGKSGNVTREFHKVSYADKDMNRLATENKGTTKAYDYS